MPPPANVSSPQQFSWQKKSYLFFYWLSSEILYHLHKHSPLLTTRYQLHLHLILTTYFSKIFWTVSFHLLLCLLSGRFLNGWIHLCCSIWPVASPLSYLFLLPWKHRLLQVYTGNRSSNINSISSHNSISKLKYSGLICYQQLTPDRIIPNNIRDIIHHYERGTCRLIDISIQECFFLSK